MICIGCLEAEAPATAYCPACAVRQNNDLCLRFTLIARTLEGIVEFHGSALPPGRLQPFVDALDGVRKEVPFYGARSEEAS